MDDIDTLLQALNSKNKEERHKAIFALGATRNRKAIEPLLSMLKDPDEEIRERALMVLSWIPDPRSIKPLIEIVRNEESTLLRSSATSALGQMGNYAVTTLIDALKDDNKYVRHAAAKALGDIKDPSAVHPLYEEINGPLNSDRSFIQKMMRSLASIGKEGIDCLVELLKSPNALIRYETANELSLVTDSKVVDPLVAALGDKNDDVRRKIIIALGTKREKCAIKSLTTLLNDPDELIVVWSLISLNLLAAAGVEDAFNVLLECLKDPRPVIRVNAVGGLSEAKNARAIPALRELADRESGLLYRGISTASGSEITSISDYVEQAIKEISSKGR